MFLAGEMKMENHKETRMGEWEEHENSHTQNAQEQTCDV